MNQKHSLTEGNILKSLLSFAVPVLFSLLLQALYGGADLLIVGRFADTVDVSGVATGSVLLSTVTNIIIGLSMGITVSVGEKIGLKKKRDAGKAIGAGIWLFTVVAALLTVVLAFGAPFFANALHAPTTAFLQTVWYIRICGVGAVFIVSYNVLSAVFRGIGDSKTPLVTVLIACLINIAGDLLLVAGFHMGAAGAATATVAAQAVSVIISLILIRKRTLPLILKKEDIRFESQLVLKELKLGVPVGLQEFLVGTSFLVIQTVVNSFGVTASAGVGVAEKVCVFIMLVPSAYMQSMSAFVAQNMGAGNRKRADQALCCGVSTAFCVGLVMCLLTFFYGDRMAAVFSADAGVIAEAHSYLKAYAIDCLLTSFLFCFTGYFNGREKTVFVMLQGLIGAFGVRIPIVCLVSRIPDVTLFKIGLATPASSLVQVLLCLGMFFWMHKKQAVTQ